MKQITVLAAALAMGGGMLLAQTPGPMTASGHDPAKGDHKQKMSAEIVSTDTSAKTITVKNLWMAKSDEGRSTSATGTTTGPMGPGETTLRLEGKAADRVSSFKAGDKVMLVCTTSASVTRPDTPTPNPEGTTTHTDPTKPPSHETDQPGSSTGTPPKRDARDMASNPTGALQSCQSVTEIRKSGS